MLITVEIIDLIAIVLFFVIAGAIACAARSGRPRNFSREMYWTAFVVAAIGGAALLVAAQRTYLTSALRIVLHCVFAVSSFALLGIAVGCGIGVYIYKGPMFSKLSRHDDGE